MDFLQPFLWADEQQLRHFPLASCPQGTSCRCLQETRLKTLSDSARISALRKTPSHGDLLFDGDLAVLVGVKRKPDVSVNKPPGKKEEVQTCETNLNLSNSAGMVHSHLLQENLSAGVVPRSVVGDGQDVVGPVLSYI